MSKHEFQTEVNQLLHLIIHSLYSHKEIFLRELISNASDACDKLKYLTMTSEEYKQVSFDPRIDISFTQGDNPILTISDSGIGMNEADIIENLGTIARSGTKNFLEKLSGDKRKDSNLIGQFGVGFYSVYMVADRVEVISRKALEDKAYRWESDGKGAYDLTESTRDSHGTTIIIHLNDEGKEYASRWSIEAIIKKYSNHISFPIYLAYEDTRYEGEGDDSKEIKENKVDQVNAASAFWKLPKAELKDEDYNEFYRSLAHDDGEPLMYIHTQAEGTLDYSTLFYLPKKAPFDMYYSDYKPGVKLFVKRVFITDDDKELLPTYLRFVRGVIDSEDLPLNVSREILQQNRILAKIKSNSVKKILSELESLAKKDTAKYTDFIREYNRPLKEGLYQDFDNRDALMELVRFKSSKVDGYTSFAEYKERMQVDQKAIYFITGTNENTLRNSPLLEMYRNKGIEVLILDEEIDEIVIPSLYAYKEIPLKSVNRSDAAEDLKSESDKAEEKAVEPVIEKIKNALKDKVKDVKASTRLSDSPACLVADSNDPTAQMQAMLKAMGQGGMVGDVKPILEINPNHPIVKKLQDSNDAELISEISELLFEQSVLIEGLKLEDPTAFVKRLNSIIQKAM